MRVTFFTEELMGGWLPGDLDAFLGGNQETLVLLGRELRRRGHTVEVYTNLRVPDPDQAVVEDSGVLYRCHQKFNFDETYDVLVSVKTDRPWLARTAAARRVHWSLDVERPWPRSLLEQLHVFTNLGTYHRSRLPWVPDELTRFAPLALPDEYAQVPDMRQKKRGTYLYATSPDRGLLTLLEDWPLIWQQDNSRELLVTYNWNRLPPPVQLELQNRLRGLPNARMALFPSKDMRGIFLTAESYVLPLNRLESDLYGFGALKAQSCGCNMVLNQVEGTGFQDSVREWQRYTDVVAGVSPLPVLTNPLAKTLPRTWREAGDVWEEVLRG